MRVEVGESPLARVAKGAWGVSLCPEPPGSLGVVFWVSLVTLPTPAQAPCLLPIPLPLPLHSRPSTDLCWSLASESPASLLVSPSSCHGGRLTPHY